MKILNYTIKGIQNAMQSGVIERVKLIIPGTLLVWCHGEVGLIIAVDRENVDVLWFKR